MWYKDDARRFNVIGPTNTGWKSRQDITAGSRLVDFVAPLKTDLSLQSKLLLDKVSIGIKININKDAFVLMANKKAGEDIIPKYKLKIEKLHLWIRVCKLAPPVALAHNQTLMKWNAKWPIIRHSMRAYTIPKDLLSLEKSGVFDNQLPIMVGSRSTYPPMSAPN